MIGDRKVRSDSAYIMLLTISAFGPYLSMGLGLRCEHVLIYAYLPVAVGIVVLGKTTLLSLKPARAITVLLFLACSWMTIATLLTTNFDLRDFNSFLASFENFVEPPAMLIVMNALLPAGKKTETSILIVQNLKILIYLLVLNAVLSLLSLSVDVSGFTELFIRSKEGSTSVAAAANTMGRYMGIINQPFECGLLYSLGVFAWIYLGVTCKSRFGLLRTIQLTMLVIGGLLSISKAFFLLGVPLALLYYLLLHRRRGAGYVALLGAITLTAVTVYVLSFYWTGVDTLLSFSKIEDGSLVIEKFTAGRYGRGDTEVFQTFDYVLRNAPLYGLGLGGEVSASDNAYLEYFQQGGVVAMGLYVSAFLILGYACFTAYKRRLEEGRFLGFLYIFLFLASLGAPVLTINRFSTVLWLVIALMFWETFGDEFGRNKRFDMAHNKRKGVTASSIM